MADEKKAKPTIVVATDFSEGGTRAFEAGMRLAADMDAAMVLVHAFQPHILTRATAPMARQDALARVEGEVDLDEALQLTTQWAAKARAEGLDVETVAREAEAAELILEAAEEYGAFMIVVGTHGRTGLKRLLMGSVAEAVLRGSNRPVLAVPPAEAHK